MTVWAATAGTVWLLLLTALLALPLGVGAAIHLEEYGGRGRFARLVERGIAHLTGVPSIVYGLVGLACFVRGLGLGRSALAAAATLALLALPHIVLSTREALRAVPPAVREHSLALGATRWQTVRHQVLPQARPAVLAGVLVALGRAVGEAAPLLMLGVLAFGPAASVDPHWPLPTLPTRIYAGVAGAGSAGVDSPATVGFPVTAAIAALLALVLGMHAVAVWLRHRARERRGE